MCGGINGNLTLKDLKSCLNWSVKDGVCNVKYVALISPKPIKFDENNFYKECKGLALPVLCCAFKGGYEEIRNKKIDKIPDVRIFEV